MVIVARYAALAGGGTRYRPRMLLLAFEVKGVRNLTGPIFLTELRPIEVLHGDNNVGKSNLLFSMRLFFLLLGVAQRDGFLPIAAPKRISSAALAERGVVLADLFHYATPFPIQMRVEVALTREELEAKGVQSLYDTSRVTVEMRVERVEDGVTVQVRRFSFADGTDAAKVQPSEEEKTRLLRFARFLAESVVVNQTTFIDVDRDLARTVDALYDAHVSTDAAHAARWERFVEVMRPFQDVFGDGQFLVVLRRDAKNAALMYETKSKSMRIPLHALGTGAQQLVAIFGALLTQPGSLAVLEEPEVHLKWVLQERVRDALLGLVGKPGAPSQLFLTSHSGAFEVGDRFLYMRATADGPVVESRPIADAASVVGQVADQPGRAHPVPTYVTTDGVLRLPPRVLDGLRLGKGGEVAFGEVNDGAVEMMSTEAFLRRTGLTDEPE